MLPFSVVVNVSVEMLLAYVLLFSYYILSLSIFPYDTG